MLPTPQAADLQLPPVAALAAALAGVMTGSSGLKAQRSTSVEEASVGAETTTAKDSTNLAATQRCVPMCCQSVGLSLGGSRDC